MIGRYRLSFTTGGLFLQESTMVSACYLQLGDWSATRAQQRDENLLQVRTTAAATRISKEVTARLRELTTLQDLGLDSGKAEVDLYDSSHAPLTSRACTTRSEPSF